MASPNRGLAKEVRRGDDTGESKKEGLHLFGIGGCWREVSRETTFGGLLDL